MPPRSNVPIRICGSKTRTGCKTCKQRHVKCDEGRPICARCLKAQRQCFYEQLDEQTALAVSQGAGRGMYSSRGYYTPRVSPDLDVILSSYGSREVTEISAIKSFAMYVGKELAGCFSNDVWCRILPRIAQHEPSIWHALVAVSELDTSLRLNPDHAGGNSIAIRHYTMAIRELNVRLGSGRNACCKDVVLLTCLLFAVFECLQNHVQSALRHITSGMKLLMEWNQEAESDHQASNGGYFNHASLQPIFLALDSQAVQMGAINIQDYLTLPALSSPLQTPAPFATLEEAHLSLNRIFNRLSRWSYWVEPTITAPNKPDDDWILAEGQRLGNQLIQWDISFENISDLLLPHPTIFLLLTQRTVLQAYYNKSIAGPSEMEWDKSLPLFYTAVQHAETYMDLTSTRDHLPSTTPPKRPIFTVAMDIVLSLYVISVKCRDSGVRHRALAMLRICGRKEGIWDSQGCAVMAEKLINFEERAAAPDGLIPETARVYLLDIRLDEEAGGQVVHKKLLSDDDGAHRVERFDEPLDVSLGRVLDAVGS